MSMRSVTLASLLLLAAISPCAAEDQAATPSAQANEPQWSEFQSPERGFAVEFPGTPKMTSTPIEGQNPLLQYDFQVSVGDDTVYTVVVFEYPAGKAPSPITDDFYVKLVNAYAKGSELSVSVRGARRPSPGTRASRRSQTATAAKAGSITSSMSCRRATASICWCRLGPRATPLTTMPSASVIPSACSAISRATRNRSPRLIPRRNRAWAAKRVAPCVVPRRNSARLPTAPV